MQISVVSLFRFVDFVDFVESLCMHVCITFCIRIDKIDCLWFIFWESLNAKFFLIKTIRSSNIGSWRIVKLCQLSRRTLKSKTKLLNKMKRKSYAWLELINYIVQMKMLFLCVEFFFFVIFPQNSALTLVLV